MTNVQFLMCPPLMEPEFPSSRDEDKSNLDPTKKNKTFIKVLANPKLCKPLQQDVFTGSKEAYKHRDGKAHNDVNIDKAYKDIMDNDYNGRPEVYGRNFARFGSVMIKEVNYSKGTFF